MLLKSSADFFNINFFKKFFLEHNQGVKWFGPRSGPTGPNCLQRLSEQQSIIVIQAHDKLIVNLFLSKLKK